MALKLYLQSNKERANAGRQLKVKEGTREALVYTWFTVSPFAHGPEDLVRSYFLLKCFP